MVRRIFLNPFRSNRTFAFWVRATAGLASSVAAAFLGVWIFAPAAVLTVIVCVPYYLGREVCRTCGSLPIGHAGVERQIDERDERIRSGLEFIDRIFFH